jgi:formiminoglutamase
LPISGQNVVELGIHGFMNAAAYMQWARDQGVTIITGLEVQRRGIADCIAEALRIAGDGADLIYLSVDIDCLAYPWAIGTAATSPEGLSAWQLLEAVWTCGLDLKVRAMDLVEIDPSRDVKDLTSRTGCSVILAFLAGLYRRLHGNNGYA